MRTTYQHAYPYCFMDTNHCGLVQKHIYHNERRIVSRHLKSFTFKWEVLNLNYSENDLMSHVNQMLLFKDFMSFNPSFDSSHVNSNSRISSYQKNTFIFIVKRLLNLYLHSWSTLLFLSRFTYFSPNFWCPLLWKQPKYVKCLLEWALYVDLKSTN